MITEAHARCAGAGRTNCSVGISDEGWKRIEEAHRQRDFEFSVWLSVAAAIVVALALTAFWLVRTGRI